MMEPLIGRRRRGLLPPHLIYCHQSIPKTFVRCLLHVCWREGASSSFPFPFRMNMTCLNRHRGVMRQMYETPFDSEVARTENDLGGVRTVDVFRWNSTNSIKYSALGVNVHVFCSDRMTLTN